MALLIGLGVLAVIALIVILLYNRLVAIRNQVGNAWKQIDVQLKRRHDLIPNLVETVKAYAKQEQTVFGDIAKARSQLLNAGTPEQKISANAQLAAQGNETLVSNIGSLSDAMGKTSTAATSVLTASSDLTATAETLSREVEAFFHNLRADAQDSVWRTGT